MLYYTPKFYARRYFDIMLMKKRNNFLPWNIYYYQNVCLIIKINLIFLRRKRGLIKKSGENQDGQLNLKQEPMSILVPIFISLPLWIPKIINKHLPFKGHQIKKKPDSKTGIGFFFILLNLYRHLLIYSIPEVGSLYLLVIKKIRNGLSYK